MRIILFSGKGGVGKTTLAAATDAVISIDAAGLIRAVNAATARLFGYPADHLPVQVAFARSAAVSLFLTTSYLRRVVGPRFARVEAGLETGALAARPARQRKPRRPDDLQHHDCIVYTELAARNAWRLVAGDGSTATTRRPVGS